MSSGDVRRLSSQDLQMVQNLIESCIQLHMSRTDAVNVLLRDAKIQPGITELVWQRLEEENREFFEVYYIRLALKEQIKLFNVLLKKQAALMEQIQSTGAASNGCRMEQFQQNAGCYPLNKTGPSMRPGNLQPTMAPTLPFTNGTSTLQTPVAFDLATSTRRNDFLSNALHVQSSNPIRSMQGLNGGIIKTESGYPSESQIIFDSDSNVVDTHAPLEDASVATFSHLEASSQPSISEVLLGIDTSFGQMMQIPKNFSFLDLSAYPHLLENYPSSAFATTDADTFLDSKDGGQITEENKNLETVSESYSIGDFAGSQFLSKREFICT